MEMENGIDNRHDIDSDIDNRANTIDRKLFRMAYGIKLRIGPAYRHWNRIWDTPMLSYNPIG